ncbi:MAG TPA: electron transfer flavoprotein subunit alpha/FixB family protein [Acidimicrobiales bacterium]|nr:electron transfer flavoprotein subunit alpha/FixB family protein [Acidimicrobiales bacterium]
MSAVVFLEHDGGELHKAPLGVLARAADLFGSADAVVVGSQATALAAEAGRFGAAVVHVADDPALDPALPAPRVDVLETVVRQGGYDTVLFSNSVLAADVAAGLAARLEAGLNWDLVDLEQRDGELVGKRPALGDSVLVDVGWRGTPRLALFRPGSFDAVETGGVAEVRPVAAALAPHSTRAILVDHRHQPDEGPKLEDAEVIVSGGMGLGAPEHFALAEELASVLGGVVGATRAAVYAGWYPASAQIGQTGKTVSPRLYVALGISGAVQHKVGMQGSKAVVAVNKDPNAPIFEFSDLAVVGDVHVIVPRLVELLRARKGS